MSKLDVIRAWKDAEYRMSLSEDERAGLPAHPAGPIELTDVELDGVAGGFWSIPRPSIFRADTCSAACLPPHIPKAPPSTTLGIG